MVRRPVRFVGGEDHYELWICLLLLIGLFVSLYLLNLNLCSFRYVYNPHTSQLFSMPLTITDSVGNTFHD